MIVWGGYAVRPISNTGGRYNPGTDSWTATSTTNAPTARDIHTAVWTGSEMIVWGGDTGIQRFEHRREVLWAISSNTYADTNTYGLTYAYTYTNGLTYAYTNTYAYTYTNAHTNTFAHTNAYAHSATADHHPAERRRSLVDGERP